MVFETSSEIIGAAGFLRLGHSELIHLFSEYELATSTAAKQKIIEKICLDLDLHMQVKQEACYPQRSKLALNHSLFKYLLSELSSIDPHSLVYDIKVRVLGDHVRLYIKETQNLHYPIEYAASNTLMVTEQAVCAA